MTRSARLWHSRTEPLFHARRCRGHAGPLARLFLFLVAMFTSPLAAATEPLVDQLLLGERSGVIWPRKCCWVGLPQSEKLLEVAKAEQCSAIGAPVGIFRLDEKKLMLTALRRCSGSFPIQDVYPDLPSPVLADWVDGVHSARLDWLCRNAANQAIYRQELELDIKAGMVTVLSERHHDKSACA